jgi:hypothetical protein
VNRRYEDFDGAVWEAKAELEQTNGVERADL